MYQGSSGSGSDDPAAAGDNDEEEDGDEDLSDLNEDDLIETKAVIVKADGAGSLTSIQDTVDTMPGISVRRPVTGYAVASHDVQSD